MTPISQFCGWNKRPSDAKEEVENYKNYYIICEGSKTEPRYFKELINNRKSLSIRSGIELILLEKTDEDESCSAPKQLIDFAKKQRLDLKFNLTLDKIIIIFDTDIFEHKPEDFESIIKEEDENTILGITNPSFELFLLLHYENSLEKYILPYEQDIIKNNWVSRNKRYIASLFSKVSGKNSKKNEKIGELASKILIAIAQESKINSNINHCKGTLTSNIGKIIKSIIDEQVSIAEML